MTTPTLDGRVALITGAGSPSGIGFAAARILGREKALLAVASTTERIHERAQELSAAGFTVSAFTADLTSSEQARDLVAQVEEGYGRIDILVNNAGMLQTGVDHASKSFAELDEAEWDLDIALNLKTAFNVTRAVLPGMLEREYGRIVNVSSVTGPLVTSPGDGGYGAAKAGMDGMTRAVAIDVARHGITVNSVAPGWIATGSSTEEELVAGRNTPIGRPGEPDEVGELIAFLASDASRYITGQSIVIDGGNTIQEYKGPPEDWY